MELEELKRNRGVNRLAIFEKFVLHKLQEAQEIQRQTTIMTLIQREQAKYAMSLSPKKEGSQLFLESSSN